MSVQDDLDRIRRQEDELRFSRFDADEAWAIGSMLRSWALDAAWPIVIDIRRFDLPLFFAAMTGSVPDNIEWARRKSNVVQRFHRSSYGLGLELAERSTTIEARYGLFLADYAAHGGGFPIAVEGVGVIGSITVSGLPQREDHQVVVRAICEALGRPSEAYALP